MGGRTELLVVGRPPVGEKLRQWRQRRGFSQLRLAVETGISARHLSYVETGRAAPSRDLILRLADHLNVSLRGRNDILLSAGYAPAYVDIELQPPSVATVSAAVRHMLEGLGAIPAMAVDNHWNLVDANYGLDLFTAGVAPELLEPPINILRLAIHPGGLPPRIVNLPQWRAHLLARLRDRLLQTTDSTLRDLFQELIGYAAESTVDSDLAGFPVAPMDPVMPLTLRDGDRELALLCTPVVFGTAGSLSVPGLAIKAFLPADIRTAQALAARYRAPRLRHRSSRSSARRAVFRQLIGATGEIASSPADRVAMVPAWCRSTRGLGCPTPRFSSGWSRSGCSMTTSLRRACASPTRSGAGSSRRVAASEARSGG